MEYFLWRGLAAVKRRISPDIHVKSRISSPMSPWAARLVSACLQYHRQESWRCLHTHTPLTDCVILLSVQTMERTDRETRPLTQMLGLFYGVNMIWLQTAERREAWPIDSSLRLYKRSLHKVPQLHTIHVCLLQLSHVVFSCTYFHSASDPIHASFQMMTKLWNSILWPCYHLLASWICQH